MALSQSECYLLAVSAGFSNPQVMSAIAMAESSGDPTVVNSIGCVGLWQINQPVWVKQYPQWTTAYLQNPVNNAMAAKTVYNAQGLGAWETYTNGAYQQYMGGAPANTGVAQAQTASWQQDFYNWANGLLGGVSPAPGLVAGGQAAGGAVNALGGLTTIATDLDKGAAWVADPRHWVRVAYVVGGGILIIVGLIIVAKPLISGAANKTVNGALAVTPEGALAKKATRAGGAVADLAGRGPKAKAAAEAQRKAAEAQRKADAREDAKANRQAAAAAKKKAAS